MITLYLVKDIYGRIRAISISETDAKKYIEGEQYHIEIVEVGYEDMYINM